MLDSADSGAILHQGGCIGLTVSEGPASFNNVRVQSRKEEAESKLQVQRNEQVKAIKELTAELKLTRKHKIKLKAQTG